MTNYIIGEMKDKNLREAFKYGTDSIMLPQAEIGNGLYVILQLEKVIEYLKTTML